MAIGNPIALTYMVGISGASAAIGQVQGFTNALRQSQAAVGQAPNMSGWMRGIGGVRTALSGIGRIAGGVLGAMGVQGGIQGFTKLIKESSNFNSDLISLQATLGLTDERTDQLRKRMEALALTTGRSRVELLAMARAGTDYGLSIDEAVDSLADLDALARIMKVAPEALMGGYGGLRKLAGAGVDAATLRTMLFEGQQASGMREEPYLELVRRAAPQFAGDKRFEGQEGTALFLANVAALGDTMGEDGKRMKSGLKALLDGLRDTTPKTIDALKKLGISTDDARKAEVQLLGAVLGGKEGIEDLPKPLREFLDQILATEGATKRLEDTQANLAGDLSGQSEELQKHLDKIKNEPTWDKLMERFKRPLVEIADGVFTWIVKHQGAIVSAFDKLGSAVAFVADNFLSFLALAALPKLGAGFSAILPITTQIAGAAVPLGGFAGALGAAAVGLYLLHQASGGLTKALNFAEEREQVKSYIESLSGSEYLTEQARSRYNASIQAGAPMTLAELQASVGEAAATRGQEPWLEAGWGTGRTPSLGHETVHGEKATGGGVLGALLGAMEKSKRPIITVSVDPRVDADATVRDEDANPSTMASASGATP